MSETSNELAARVLVGGVPKVLSYSLDDTTRSLEVGAEVIVDVGSRETRGWMIEKVPFGEVAAELSSGKPASPQLSFLPDAGPHLKPIKSGEAVFLPEQLKLFRWMSSYYGVPLVDVIENAIPSKSMSRVLQCVSLTPEFAKLCEENPDLREKLAKKAPLQEKLIVELEKAPLPVPLSQLETLGTSVRSAVKSLAKKNLVSIGKYSAFSLSNFGNAPQGEVMYSSGIPSALTTDQSSCLKDISAAITSRSFSPFLLFGVTGSGKTEVYLQAIRQVLQNNGSALIIVPEIALTPQLVDQFQARLSEPIALLHSQVGSSARWEAWQALLKGEIKVAIGARSAVFAPLPDLSLIIVDEEHESSYKQSDGLRYNARDVAVMRANFAQCSVLLGSATPSFESLVNVKKENYRLLELPNRVSDRPLPKIELVDMSKVRRSDMPSENISPNLFDALKETLNAKGQAVIFYNKRGFASYLQCETCSEVVPCPNCSVPLTFHQRKNQLLCHYCNLSMLPPPRCTVCRNPTTTRVETDSSGEATERESVTEKVGKLVHRGAGTEKVVEELGVLFPKAKMVRMDRDTVGKKGAYREILGSMRSGEADILIGTQMIAKGHDLPNVTLVGIIDADVGLHLPDFRSSEKAFQLITQASGRAGRGTKPGRVILQTREPNHPTIVAAVTNKFKAFARYELDYRKKLSYPPISRLCRLLASSTDRQEAFNAAQLCRSAVDNVVEQIRAADPDQKINVLGPAPAPYERLRGRYRWHILIKSPSAKTISQCATALNKWRVTVNGFDDFRLGVDVDPMDLL